jgi:hypothetical protein
VQTAQCATQLLDRLATEYSIYVTIPGHLHQSPTPVMILIAAHHVAPATCTPRDKQMRFSNETKNKGKTTEMSWIQIQASPSQLLITIKPRN